MRAHLRQWLSWPLVGVIALQLMLGNLAHPQDASGPREPATAQPARHVAAPEPSQHGGHCAEAANEVPQPATPHEGHGKSCCAPDGCHCNVTLAVPAAAPPVLGLVACRSSPDIGPAVPARPRPDRLLRPPALPTLA